MSAREESPRVELVDTTGRSIGEASKQAAHTAPGQLHRAISVFLLDPSGRLILQRRADTKYHSAGCWTNTCCGHPLPGEPPVVAAVRRLDAELGIAVLPEDLEDVGTIAYRVSDPASGLVEHEHDHLFVGWQPGPLRPDPLEVSEVAAVGIDEIAGRPLDASYSPWFDIVLRAALPGIRAAVAVGAGGTGHWDMNASEVASPG